MALIPPDVGLQLRAQTESQLQPVGPIRPIPVDLPALQVGQSFTARIQEALPENVFRALIAGKAVTLQLPEGARAGDLLELVVVDRTPRLLVAHRVAPGQVPVEGDPRSYPFATMSRAAQMIGQLLVAEGETPAPAQLNRGQPMLARPPANAQDLLPALKAAVSQSGMFYESHQAQWVAGAVPLARLLQEPQGQLSQPSLLAAHRVMQEAAARGAEPAGRSIDAAPAAAPSPAQIGRADVATPPGNPAASPASSGLPVPEELRPLVQQQLEAAAGQRLMWQGVVWPGQTMDWQIEWERRQKEGGDNESAPDERWRTTLALTTPRLGRMEALLQLADNGVVITIAAPGDASAGKLRDAAPELATALGAAGVPLLSIQVK